MREENLTFPTLSHSPFERTQLTNISGTECLWIIFTNICLCLSLFVCLFQWSLKILTMLTLNFEVRWLRTSGPKQSSSLSLLLLSEITGRLPCPASFFFKDFKCTRISVHYLPLCKTSAFISIACCFVDGKMLFFNSWKYYMISMTGVCISCSRFYITHRAHSSGFSVLLWLHSCQRKLLRDGLASIYVWIIKKWLYYKNLGLPVEFKFQINHKLDFGMPKTYLR